ncbi:MAG: TRAP transporter substrate-binding protein DctP [Deltaproteobacteria bacterium]|jgi:TRAP-type mannitol/chloroaromatic compound transport system substrate-binding protein|nr:TRAP transporter substrate-binding protein DctP [Deltaproteobacteria bacterium]
MKRVFSTALSFVVCAAMLALFTAPASAAGKGTKEDPIVWRMSGLYARGIAFAKTYETFARNVEQMSGGRMKIEVSYDGEGVPATELLTAVSSGLIEVGNPYQALHAGEFPAGIVEIGLPDGPESFLELRAMYYEGGWLEALREAYASINCYFLAEAPQPPTYLLTKKPINSLEDLKTMKIRCPGAYGLKMNNLGASTVTMALSEVYSSLASGLIDGVNGCNLVDHHDIKSYEMAKYLYKLPVANAQMFNLVCNMDAFKALPDDLKRIVEVSAEIVGNDSAHKSVVWEKEALNEMLAAGLQYSPDPSPADVKKWREAGRKVWEEYAKKDKFCKKLLDLQKDFMKRLGHDV